MAKVFEKDGVLTLKLSTLEKLGALHGDLTISSSQLVSKSEVSNPWKRLYIRGFRAPGTGFPFLIMLGTMRFKGGKDFCAIYRRTPAAIYEFADAPFKRWIVSL